MLVRHLTKTLTKGLNLGMVDNLFLITLNYSSANPLDKLISAVKELSLRLVGHHNNLEIIEANQSRNLKWKG